MHGPLIWWAAAVRNQPHEGGAAQGRESKDGGCQLPRLWGLLEERVKPFPWQRTRKRTRRQQRVRRSASGLKLPRARGHLANGEGASASRDGRPAALPCRARGKIFFRPPLFLLRGLGHGTVLARGATALARVSGRRGEAVAVASRAGAGKGAPLRCGSRHRALRAVTGG